MMIKSGTIDMQDLRYLNLFAKVTHVDTRHVIKYNDMIIFCVPKELVPRAVGERGNNVRQISEILGRRIKIIPLPQGIEHVKQFIQAIVSPVEFNGIDVKENEIILNSGPRSKAALLGRNKRRLMEMQKIIKDFFGKEFKII